MDPYDHPIVVHTYPGQYDEVYTPLLGLADFDGASLQMNKRGDDTHSRDDQVDRPLHRRGLALARLSGRVRTWCQRCADGCHTVLAR